MDPKQALDSRKFCMLMDDLARTWRDKKATEQDKEFRLTALFLWLEEQEADQEDEKARAPRRQAPPPPEVYQDPPGTEDDQLTPAQATLYAKLADEAKAATASQEEIVRQVIAEHIKPQVEQQGLRTLCVPLRWKGRAVSTNADRWKQCLEEAGIFANVIEWSHDPRSWRGPAPVPGVSIPMVLA